ncbi:MAG: hypothetical protein JO335_00065 [Sphingomonas sp.]|nr:hypothetical protein [Sphingomonas sp.]
MATGDGKALRQNETRRAYPLQILTGRQTLSGRGVRMNTIMKVAITANSVAPPVKRPPSSLIKRSKPLKTISSASVSG